MEQQLGWYTQEFQTPFPERKQERGMRKKLELPG
jgi:hypothetical protein